MDPTIDCTPDQIRLTILALSTGAAKMRAPCVIFIDEIDSVGAKRSNSVLHPYANQTINQLLSEMDGFHKNEGVIVLGATNRRDDLDKALLRPGRFDVEVQVSSVPHGYLYIPSVSFLWKLFLHTSQYFSCSCIKAPAFTSMHYWRHDCTQKHSQLCPS